MPEHQFDFAFDPTDSSEPAIGGDLRDEIAGVWGLPVGERIEVFFRDGQLDSITGALELAAAPDYPWNPRQPLQLRIAGFVFSTRDIEHWARV